MPLQSLLMLTMSPSMIYVMVAPLNKLLVDSYVSGMLATSRRMDSVIHCFIHAACATQIRHELQEGAIFNLARFEVGRCTNLYKITDHPLVIRFLPTTTIAQLPDATATIKREKFMLRKIDHLQALASTNLELPDVVGQIRFVQGSNLDDATSKQRLVVQLLVDTSITVYLSLWDDAATTFHGHLSSSGTMNSVMLVTTVNPKLFGGNLYLNSTAATRFFFDTRIDAIQQFTKRHRRLTSFAKHKSLESFKRMGGHMFHVLGVAESLTNMGAHYAVANMCLQMSPAL
ncbi:unnamed protein product [Arabis nemorensis]|uniref:Replication protein A OB domain-containing protein n=1 Tax=Arabis nemorensis TaxID=586526 RepID=A0A565CVH4_9BRAS|nr:unnamed protein product [Arabis nemorensis]